MTDKIRYEVDLTTSFEPEIPNGLTVRSISKNDLDGLAHLMLNAYIGTIDYDDETL